MALINGAQTATVQSRVQWENVVAVPGIVQQARVSNSATQLTLLALLNARETRTFAQTLETITMAHTTGVPPILVLRLAQKDIISAILMTLLLKTSVFQTRSIVQRNVAKMKNCASTSQMKVLKLTHGANPLTTAAHNTVNGMKLSAKIMTAANIAKMLPSVAQKDVSAAVSVKKKFNKNTTLTFKRVEMKNVTPTNQTKISNLYIASPLNELPTKKISNIFDIVHRQLYELL